jgi:hypothetical protein
VDSAVDGAAAVGVADLDADGVAEDLDVDGVEADSVAAGEDVAGAEDSVDDASKRVSDQHPSASSDLTSVVFADVTSSAPLGAIAL